MKTIATHNGGFHADDVFAVATIMLAYPHEEWKVVRTRDEAIISTANIVVDVGRVRDDEAMRFDHHQEGGAGARENGIPYASFGLVWRMFAKEFTSPEAVAIVDSGLVSFADAIDNGVDMVVDKTEVGNFSISDVVGGFNRPGATPEYEYEKFLEVVEIAKKIILNEVAKAEEFLKGKKEIEEVYEHTEDKRLLVLEHQYSKGVLYATLDKHPEVLYIVQPYDQNGYALRALKKEKGSFNNRKDLPEEWAGKVDEEFEKISGVMGARFCHNKRFVANAKTKEAAVALAKLALEN